MTNRRLTRAEQKEETRARLLAAAARVFARRGYQSASVEEVAEDAGFSKGAVYSNFAGKEELFLAMIDARFAQRLEDIRRVVAEPLPPGEQAHLAGDVFMRSVGEDPDWLPLFLEVWAYGQRNPHVRRRLVRRMRDVRDEVAEILSRRAEELGVELPFAPAQVAAMTFAMATGTALQRALDPDAVPAELYGSMLEAFFAGLRELAPVAA